MGIIYFIRHGETVSNINMLVCGSVDSPLTEKGRNQARMAGEELREKNIKADVILYSPLLRAAETAKIIAEKTGIPLKEEPRLTEQCFGEWENTPITGGDFLREKQLFAVNYGNGESAFRLAQRIYNFLDELTKKKDGNYILVAHTAVSKMVNAYFHDMTNDEYNSYRTGNCQVVEYTF